MTETSAPSSPTPPSNEPVQLPREQVLRNRWKLIGIVLVFTLPVFFAYAGFFGGWFQHHGRSNRGELLQPVEPIANWQWQFADGQAFDPGRKWWLVYVRDTTSCDAACELQLYTLQQTWLGIGKDNDRVRTAVLGDIDAAVLPEQAVKLQATLDSLREHKVQIPAYYIIDPVGNIVLRYQPPRTQADAIERSKDIRSDFKKLLRFSHIG